MGRKRLIKNIVTKPSEALQAMVDGLRKQSKRKDFIINMDTFGVKIDYMDGVEYKKSTCFGCAATCTVQEIAAKNLSCELPDLSFDTQAKELGFEHKDIRNFERAIDNARKGYFGPLFGYLNVTFGERAEKIADNSLWSLSTDNWKRQLRSVEATIRELQKAGY